MRTLHDIARFRPGDEPALVEASFCCQLCLHRPAWVLVSVDDDDGGAAWCYCARCHLHTAVSLNAEQVVRLALAPPRGARLQLVREDEL